MNLYATPKEGTYDYKSPNFDGTFRTQPVKVAVLGESETQYLVRVKVPINGRPAGSLMRVWKRNVLLLDQKPEATPKRERVDYDYSDAYWHD